MVERWTWDPPGDRDWGGPDANQPCAKADERRSHAENVAAAQRWGDRAANFSRAPVANCRPS
jgi:hypothetical protein